MIILRRRNAVLEAEYDNKYIRLPRQLAWVPKSRLWEMKFPESVCHIVGKGPSLDNLTPFSKGDLVIALNEAVYKVEESEATVFGTFFDPPKQKVKIPKRATILSFEHLKQFYSIYPDVIWLHRFEFGKCMLSVQVALGIAKMFGCPQIELHCFDACINGNTDYAKCVGLTSKSGGLPSRFLKHRTMINETIERLQLNVVWK